MPEQNTTAPINTSPIIDGTFPREFLWGSATAAAQIEGAAHEDGREDSIWDAFARVSGAVDHYHRMPEDVALMRRLGLQSYRFSTSWARIKPGDRELNRKGLGFYSRLVDELLEAGILPWLTLYHWDLPQAVQEKGGWADRDTAYRFRDYATAVHHQHLGHGLATRALRDLGTRHDRELQIGITLSLTNAVPNDPSDPVDLDAARRIDGLWNRMFLEPMLLGAYPSDVPDDVRDLGLGELIRPGDLAVIGAPIDFLGVNHYHDDNVSGHPLPQDAPGGLVPTDRPTASPFPGSEFVSFPTRHLPRTAMGWEVNPEGLRTLLVRLGRDYPRLPPLYVTENGASYDGDEVVDGHVHDNDRKDYITAHLHAIAEAIAEGADVRGYFVWSLLDNFEWSWGFEKRFGIVHVDYGTQVRTIKDSGLEYARIIAGHRQS